MTDTNEPSPAESDSRPGKLPLDPDLVSRQPKGREARPVHLRWSYIAVVFVGGTAGTASREALSLLIPPLGSSSIGSISLAPLPVATLGINLVGAFLLGVLLDALVRSGPDDGGRRTLRLMLGTGFLGGFTTYSALATDTSLLIGSGDVPSALLYSLGTLLLGAGATWAGIAITAAVHFGSKLGSASGLQSQHESTAPKTAKRNRRANG